LLIRVLGAKSVLATVLVVVFVLTWPIIHVRYSHAALMMHSIMVSALALYFLGVQKQWRSTSVATAFIILNLTALLVHPYFVPFTVGLFVAFLVDEAMQNKHWGKQAIRLFVLFVLIAALGVVMGYFWQEYFQRWLWRAFQIQSRFTVLRRSQHGVPLQLQRYSYCRF
jgi:hypothetical protein